MSILEQIDDAVEEWEAVSPDVAEWTADGSHEGRPVLPRPWADPDLSAVSQDVWGACLRIAEWLADQEDEEAA